jgi:uncharacterized protein (DUF1684 family)
VIERWQRWREARAASLAAPDSWLGLIGLFWLEEGANPVGSDPDTAVVRFPDGAARLGVLECAGMDVVWHPAEGAAMPLATDAGGAPTVVELGSYAFFVIARDGRLAVRLRDRGWAAKRPFAGVETFDYEPRWRIEAAWRPLSPPQVMEVPNVSGDLKLVEVAWQAIFAVEGRQVVLLPMHLSDEKVFFVFRDATSGRISYGAGRFLDATPPRDGRIVLDFNFAYSPPCAFTPFATCPLPPPENWLSFPVEAGERMHG